MKLEDDGLPLRGWDWIQEENIRQLNKWGFQKHTSFEWLAYITEELGELSKAVCEHKYRDGNIDEILEEAIQVATLAIKIAGMYFKIKEKE